MPGGVRERDIKINAKLARKAGGKKQARAITTIRKKIPSSYKSTSNLASLKEI